MDDEVLVQQRDLHCLIPLKTLTVISGLPELHRGRGHARPKPSLSPFRQGMGRTTPNVPPFSAVGPVADHQHPWPCRNGDPAGRNLDLTLAHGEETLALGRTASERFKQFIEANRLSRRTIPTRCSLRNEMSLRLKFTIFLGLVIALTIALSTSAVYWIAREQLEKASPMSGFNKPPGS